VECVLASVNANSSDGDIATWQHAPRVLKPYLIGQEHGRSQAEPGGKVAFSCSNAVLRSDKDDGSCALSCRYKPPAPEVFVPALAAWPAALRQPAPPTTLAPRPTLN
jgi:hypothetical protein